MTDDTMPPVRVAPKPDYVKIERTCRYGHGPLIMDPEVWGMPGVNMGRPSRLNAWGLKPEEVSYMVRVHVCPRCGYVELEDFA